MESPEFTLQIALVLGVVLVTIILFITEWLRVDVVVNRLVAKVFADRHLRLDSDAMAWRPVAHVQAAAVE